MRPVEDWADLMYDPDHPMHHVVPFGQQYALCGASPVLMGGWYGTGAWQEYETAHTLPRCAACAASVTQKSEETA